MITLQDNDFATVQFVEEYKLVQTIWKKDSSKMTFEDYKNTFEVGLDFQKENKEKIKFYLSDIRSQGVMPPEYRKWIQTEGIPKAKENGVSYGAVVFDGNVFQKYYLNNIMNSTKKLGMKFKFVSQYEDAIEWFKSLDE